MKKINKKSMFFIAKSLISLCLTVALLFFLPTVHVFVGDNASFLYEAFIGKKSKYQGIIEIWNIDTFEAGTASKDSFLEARAKDFEKQNKGLYFLIRNVTEQECMNMLEAGELPDLFSCSFGVAPKLQKFLKPVSTNKFGIAENYLKAGKIDKVQFALPWCRGAYCLISTKANLEKAKVNTDTKFDLISNALKLGYEVHGKKKTHSVFSLSFGRSNYLMPENALLSYNVNILESNEKLAFNAETAKSSTYSAYCSFIAGESVMLLGTQRDVARMENRVKNGKASDVVYAPLLRFNDLVQFVMIAKSNNSNREFYAEEFAKFLVSKSSQSKLSSVGMFSVLTGENCAYENGVMFDIALENISTHSIPKLFL